MHLIKRSREQKPRDFIPTQSIFARLGPKLTRNKRYSATGEFLGYSRPLPFVDAAEVARVKAAQAKGAALGKPADEVPFDMARYRPLPTRILVSRGPLIKEAGGVALTEDAWHYGKLFIVKAVGADVTSCAVGDTVFFGKGFRPVECWLGTEKFYIGRDLAVVAVLQPVL